MSRRIRVLHVITRLVVGGAQENTLLTVRSLDRNRYELTLASGPSLGPEGSLESEVPEDVVFVRIPELTRSPHPLKDPVALGKLYRLMRQGRYHLVHTHTTKAGILGRIAARWAGAPVVVHTPHGHAFHGYLGPLGSKALRRVEAALARWTDAIVCLTEAERADHLRLGVGRPEQLEVIHSGVDLSRFCPPAVNPGAKRQELGLPDRARIIGCVARLVPVKGVQVLLEAVPRIRERVPEAVVVFVGDGELRPQLERRARELGVDGAVRFLGLRRDVAEIVPLFEVAVQPSLNEGMGKAAVEAMAAGKPVVASAVSGLVDVVRPDRNGVLVPPGDPEALARAVTDLFLHPERMREFGRAARQDAEVYGVEAMVDRLEALYERLLRAKGF
ncbi:MAG: glycosyltransferase family 4 protein [Armatimonadota bacterium]|nr:glycosyltransferase family 4 protein [Armatimonadota bacterium]MDR7443519.1 glycosyltransferase family 4 protein [Armatimonadota bacterium]MDR7570352.1 glycosyltransferase family 4 protein [Armatimonadota bacterium]MDR7615018.1 glycosyltransferase family 4 protein [Armatimonadota bacterium]